MLDEATLRRPDFLPGAPIQLADGQWWTFPLPVGRGGAAAAAFGGDHAALVAAIREAEDEVDLLRAELALAIALLDRNYRLGPEEYRALLAWGPSSPALAAMQRAFRAVAREHAEAVSDPAPLRSVPQSPPGRPTVGIAAASIPGGPSAQARGDRRASRPAG